jgi:hypothetical protein
LDEPLPFTTDPIVEGLDRKRVKYVMRRAHFSLPWHHSYHAPDEFAAIITAVRDPRDVAISCWYHFTYPRDEKGLEQCVRQLCGLEDAPPLQPMIWGGYAKDRAQNPGRLGWGGFVINWLEESVPFVRYEDHLARPEETLTRLIGDLGFRTPASRIAAAVEANRFENRKKDNLMRVGKAGQWREIMPARLVRLIAEHVGDVMEELGYEL